MPKSTYTLAMALLTMSAVAHAEAPRPEDLQRLAKSIPTVAPEPGIETAKVGPPQWCAESSIEGSWSPASIRIAENDTIETFEQNARLVCLWPNDPTVQKAAQAVQQIYMNWTGQSVARAVDSMKAHVAKAHWQADRTKLCQQLAVNAEVGGGEEVAFMTIRRKLFGCGNGDNALWLMSGADTTMDDAALQFLDNSVAEPDTAVRMGWLTGRLHYLFTNDASNPHSVVGYVFDQFDLGEVTEAKVAALADTAPYKGNVFARAVLFESYGHLMSAKKKVDAEVAKLTADPDWKQILVTGPQAAAAAYDKSAAQYKAEITRSNEFEAKFWGPSKRALAGCWPTLRKDFIGLAKATKHTSATEFKQWLSEPVASLLFSRLVACAAVETDPAYANELLIIDRDLRLGRGRRVAAYFGAFDAINAVLKDRTRFPISAKDMWFFGKRLLNDAASGMVKTDASKFDSMGWVMETGAGTVKSVAKAGAMVKVSFVTTHAQYMSTSCTTDTSRIVMFDHGGSPIYYSACKDTGMVTYNNTPADIKIPAEWADGIKAGAVLEYTTARGEDRVSLPTAVYADKTRKQLVNYYGLGF